MVSEAPVLVLGKNCLSHWLEGGKSFGLSSIQQTACVLLEKLPLYCQHFSCISACFKYWCGLNCLQNASAGCLLGPRLFAVSSIYMVVITVSVDQRAWGGGKRDAFVWLSDKREAYAVWVRLGEHDCRTGWNLILVFQQNYSITINNITVVGMDLEICWWPCLPKLRQPRATMQARMKSCSWIWGDTIKGSRIKLGRVSSCYVQFAS